MSVAPDLTITYPPELPVSEHREELARAIRDHQVVIVAGATGSGKTTQLPKICLELGRESIGHTQPRRIAARTIAERIASELGTALGGLIGYQVRFDDRSGADTRVKLMTDGILLNEIHFDKTLAAYDTIIIDEAHERSLTIDFLLGYLRRLLPHRPDLKVIITSATIDPDSFARHFADAEGTPAPVVEVSGRTYPVDIRYRPLVGSADDTGVDADTGDDDRDHLTGIGDAVDELSREEPGDVLVFLSGENEIRDAQDALAGRVGADTEILPLYGRLAAKDQHRVFERGRRAGIRRRIVLATNVAETSLTVPGVRYVVDAGTARISRYSPRSKVQRLPIEAISQASANQRSGRAGRTSPGIAIRLYSREDFERRPEFTDPEILRTSLAAVMIQMVSLGLGALEDFPFLTPPERRDIRAAVDLLTELGVIDAEATTLTRVGREVARLPLDPRFARMVVESHRHGCTPQVLAIVAGLTVQDPRERPLDKRAQADQLHARFVDKTSDFLGLLNLWNYLGDKRRELSSSAFRRLCRAEYINYVRVREWLSLYRQLERTVRPRRGGRGQGTADGIHRSLLAGLLSHIGLRDAKRKDYVGARQSRFVIFPGSALAKRQPRAVMSAELVETSRLFARVNAAIDPAWAEQIAPQLCKRSHSEPHWEAKRGAAIVFEKVTLYGVPIVERRRVQYARIDRPHAREIFLRHALVDPTLGAGASESDDLTHTLRSTKDAARAARTHRGPQRRGRGAKRSSLWGFVEANRRVAAELTEVEERTRRRDILVGDEAIVEFYDARVPESVATRGEFEAWWRDERTRRPELLTLTPDAVRDETSDLDESQYPSQWSTGEARLDLAYRFEPGADDDGLTVRVPLTLLPGLGADGFDWQVPGMRTELITAMIRVLPKSIRRHVVPAADWAARLHEALPAPDDRPDEPFAAVLAATISRMAQMPVAADDFDLERLPDHLRPRFAVVDERGRVRGADKDLDRLKHDLADEARSQVATAVERRTHRLEQSGLTSWSFGELPDSVETKQAGGVVRAYPAVVDDGDSVSVSLVSTEAEQRRATRAGVRRLLLLTVPSPASYVRNHVTDAEKLALAASPYRSVQALLDDCLIACADAALSATVGDDTVLAEADFARVRDAYSAGLVEELFGAVSVVASTLRAARTADKAIAAASSITLMTALADARGQLDALVFDGFVARTGLVQLRRLPVYLDGLVHRVSKLPESPGRDRTWQAEVEKATERYRSAGGTLPLTENAPAGLAHVRWMLEELRLSLFAQHLPTAEPVSLKRIAKALATDA